MARPQCCRRISHLPHCALFRPAGVAASDLDEVALSLDELEALRLADLEGMYHEQGAERMNVSRQTFGRTLEQARRKVAQALVEGRALRIQGGTIAMARAPRFGCAKCRGQGSATRICRRSGSCPGCGRGEDVGAGSGGEENQTSERGRTRAARRNSAKKTSKEFVS